MNNKQLAQFETRRTQLKIKHLKQDVALSERQLAEFEKLSEQFDKAKAKAASAGK